MRTRRFMRNVGSSKRKSRWFSISFEQSMIYR
ncbi:hypothetical protein LINPERPRIM_LOCUS26291 [Linum perenne]